MNYVIQAPTPFADSLIWQLNRDYYDANGIGAWRDGTVPFFITSNSMVGHTYAKLIFAFLRDLAAKGQVNETVYILELGAGHGKLAFHILKHLERLTDEVGINLPHYCYVISDVVEENLRFFHSHQQFQPFFESEKLDIAYFDATQSTELILRQSGITINPGDLNQPILVLANYFFDSIPTDLFHLKTGLLSSCSISLRTGEDPEKMPRADFIKKMKVSYQDTPVSQPYYPDSISNEILGQYQIDLQDTYLFYPKQGLTCLDNLKKLSQKGLVLISMDKGFHQLKDLNQPKEPEMITHGSVSFWVNYHSMASYCEKHGGKAFLPEFSTFHLELACLLFLEESDSYTETHLAYRREINDFGPDDFNGLKKFAYKNLATITLPEIIALLRLGAYDSTLFKDILPFLRREAKEITLEERDRLFQTLHQVWNMYFTLFEKFDLAFEIGGIFYDLGFYEDALDYFANSIEIFGHNPDILYNQALCYFQLRDDHLFKSTVEVAKSSFPDFPHFAHLDTLDLNSK